MRKPKVCILRTAGTNCDKETAFAFSKVGADTEFVHINNLVSGQKKLEEYEILAFSGGFSYGDDLGAGKVLANELKFKIREDILKFIKNGKLVIGICNGFQILVKAGLLPRVTETFEQEASLIINDSGKFEDRWVFLKSPAFSHPSATLGAGQHSAKCIWTKNLPEIITLPVAHGEGKFITKDKEALERLKKNGQIVFQYCDDKGALGGYPYCPNGSIENIAGICDETGRIFGLMPHPERHIESLQNPSWTASKKILEGDGLGIFKNGVEYVKRTL